MAPFLVVADYESILKPVNRLSGEHSTKKDEHVACSYSYLITSSVPGVEFESRLYVGPDAAEHFLLSLQNDLNNDIMSLIERDVDVICDDDPERRFNEATDCYICNKPLNLDQNIIVRDHDHFEGHFRGAVHQACKLQYRIDNKHYKLLYRSCNLNWIV